MPDLKQDHASRLRNPLIAGVFYRRRLIEQWGRGTQKIVTWCVAAGQPEPEFEEQAGAVVVRFRPSGYHPPLRVGHDLTERQQRGPPDAQQRREMAFSGYTGPVVGAAGYQDASRRLALAQETRIDRFRGAIGGRSMVAQTPALKS